MKSTPTRLCLLTAAILLAASVVTGQTTSPPEYDVDIVFLGLMGFDMSNATAPVAIIPNVKNGYQQLGNDGHMVAKHIGYVLATLAELPEDHPLNNAYDFKAPDENADKYHYLDLNGEQIAFDDENVAGLNGPVSYKLDGCTTSCPTKDNQTNLCWLSSLQDVDGDPNIKKNDRYFNRMPPVSSVTARAVLGYGKLDAHVIGMVLDNKLQAPKWDFRTPNQFDSDHDETMPPQALAQEVHWTFKAKELPFVLNLIGLNGGFRRLAFMPTFETGAQRGHLMIVVGSTPQEDTGPVADPKTPTRDDHYSVYQRFVSSNDGGKGKIPTPRMITVSGKETIEMCADSAFLFPPALMPEQTGIITQAGAPQAAKAKQQNPHMPKQSAIKKTPKSQAQTQGAMEVADDGEGAPGGLNCTGFRWQPPIVPTRQ